MKKYRVGECEHEELCDLATHRMITWSDWIDAQPQSYSGYDEWLESRGLRRNNRNASQFIREYEDSIDFEEYIIEDEEKCKSNYPTTIGNKNQKELKIE